MSIEKIQNPVSPDYNKFTEERHQLKQNLYKKLLLYIMSTNAALVVVELIRVASFNRMDMIPTFIFLLIFIILISSVIVQIKDRQELAITVFIGTYYLLGLIACYYGETGYIDNTLDAFYFSYALALFERLVMARIPTSSYKIVFSICTMIIRSAVVPFNDAWIFTIQVIYVFFGIGLDLDKEKNDKNLVQSYFNSKNQLEKFKNLVVNDIPDSIAILSQDLSHCLFANTSFSQLSGADINSNIRAHLTHYEVQEEEKRGNSTLYQPKKTLLSFLANTINDNPEFLGDKKFSCNLTYNKKTTSLDLQEEQNANTASLFEAKVFSMVWDEVPAVAIILHDITQQHTILSLKIADAHKDTLLATVSHELRTPLNGMLGMIQILQKRTSDPESVKYLNICKNSGNLLMGLVNSILDLNQIRVKKLKLNPERVNLLELLNDMIHLFELQCSQKGVYLKLNVSSSTQKYLVTDHNRLSQIFINLIGNALKFTIKGGITIFAKESYDGKYIRLSVEDTGIGIKEEDKGKLFKMFGKLEQNDSRTNLHGVGLGLTIADNLARLLCPDEAKGGIKLESTPGEGSKFSFWVRTKLADDFSSLENLESDFASLSTDEDTDVERRLKEYVLAEKEPAFKRMQYITGGCDSLVSTKSTQDNMSSCRNNQLCHMPHFKSETCINIPRLVTRSNINVLIVDDNPFNIVVAEYMITSQGYKTKTALYGQTAIDIISNTNFEIEPIKLILMDCQMPIMSGYQTTQVLNKLMQQGKIPTIPVVALTANNSEVDKEASRRAGMCDHLTKPLKEAELFRILNKYVA